MRNATTIYDCAKRFAAAYPVPVCAGCPDGAFERQVDEWLTSLAKQLTFETGARWGVRAGQLYEEIATGVLQWRVATELHPGGGKTIRVDGTVTQVLPSMAPLEWAEPLNQLTADLVAADLEERDRIAEILQRLERLEANAENDRKRLHTIIGLGQRMVMLLVGFATAPIKVTLRLPWVGTIELDAERRPVTVEDAARGPHPPRD